MNYFFETMDIIIGIFRSGNQDIIEHVYKVLRSVYDTMLKKEVLESGGAEADCGHNSCKIIPFPIPKKRRAGRERIGNQNRKAV